MKIIVKNDLAKMFQEYSQKFFLGEEENEQRYPLARHILHICIDGLRPDCMPNATSGMPNMLDRLAYQGYLHKSKNRFVVLEPCNDETNYCVF